MKIFIYYISLAAICIVSANCKGWSAQNFGNGNGTTRAFPGENREGKFLPFLALVKIGGAGLCKGDSGESGACMKKSQCISAGGTDLGKCAQGYGICCSITKKCSDDPVVINTNGTKLVQDADFHELCRYEIPKQSGVCQIRLDFERFQIAEGPMTEIFGTCDADTLTITSSISIGPLCGSLDGQHMYLDYGNNDKISLDIYMPVDLNQMWNVMVTMIKCDSSEKAPSGCLQYYTAQRGMVKSFNYNLMHQLNTEDYSVCVRTNPGMKKITWRACSPEDFQISLDSEINVGPVGIQTGDDCTTDYISIYGEKRHCGTYFPDSAVSTTQPFLMQVHFNDFEVQLPPPENGICDPPCDYKNTGFCLMYAQTPN